MVFVFAHSSICHTAASVLTRSSLNTILTVANSLRLQELTMVFVFARIARICEDHANRGYSSRVRKYLDDHYPLVFARLPPNSVSCEDLITTLIFTLLGRGSLYKDVAELNARGTSQGIPRVKYVQYFRQEFRYKIRAVSIRRVLSFGLSLITALHGVRLLIFTHTQHLVTLTHPRSEPDPNFEHGDADTLCPVCKVRLFLLFYSADRHQWPYAVMIIFYTSDTASTIILRSNLPPIFLFTCL